MPPPRSRRRKTSDRRPPRPRRKGERPQDRGAELERLVAIGQVASVLARQMRNRLTNMALLVELLARRTDDRELRAKLTEMDTERRRLTSVVKDLLEFSEPRATGPRLMDLRGVVQEALDALRPRPKPHVALRVTLGRGPAYVRGDPVQAGMAISSLLRRAAAVTARGPVTVNLRRARTGWSIVIRDSGPHLSADDLLRLFEPGFRGPVDRDWSDLGLYFARTILRGNGGDLEVSSGRGGTTYTVWLPSA